MVVDIFFSEVVSLLPQKRLQLCFDGMFFLEVLVSDIALNFGLKVKPSEHYIYHSISVLQNSNQLCSNSTCITL